MFFSFLFWSFKKRRAMPFWKTVSKERFRLYSYFFFKAGWPTSLRPSPWVRRFTQRVGGSGNERPNLKHLLQGGDLPPELHSLLQKKQKYFCVMPSSRWKGKKWPVDSYFQTLSQLADVPVILGTDYDQESKELVRKLEMSGVSHISGVGRWSLKQTALILSHSAGYLGGDTGLAHLAEAVGVSASVIFGPSSSDMGFGPWKKESRSIEIPLVCRPCSKDGRFCYRLTKKYACLKNLSPQIVIETLKC